ncbi:TPA: phosphoribosylformylglycinamidine cyclo-ligase [bacterium]|nr:phosphoribosylformylglycinamidine cyclo-ligase [bacterium]
MNSLTYKETGVDIDRGNELVKKIRNLAKETFSQGVLGGIGGFSGLFELDLSKYRQPVLVSSCDGVGTKLKVASLLNRHNTVGIDLVAMCVNDLIVSGAKPLFFLDYLAMGRLNLEVATQLIEGIVAGCQEAGCSLIGGETAEMPGIYQEGDYDLAGFSLGIVEKEEIIDGGRVVPGDVLIGLASNGLHSNGYSLVRKVFEREIEEFGEELLKPTRIYVKTVLSLMENLRIKGIAHITGGGFIENIPRVLPEGMRAVIQGNSWEIPPIFKLIRERGEVSFYEMYRTFNMGIGLVIIVAKEVEKECFNLLQDLKENAFSIGRVERGEKEVIVIGE